ncbi:hypothetical protein D025_3948 [Vibrio parahaemolyticus 949]|nr:hypothetical protein D025_3948 [Vibrio parahaemolyticus 949]
MAVLAQRGHNDKTKPSSFYRCAVIFLKRTAKYRHTLQINHET